MTNLKRLVSMMSWVLCSLLPSASHANLQAVGYPHPEHGFPTWYRDSKNVTLELCLHPLDLKCPEPSGNVDPNKPILFPTNFPNEAYWWLAETEAAVEGGGTVHLVLALQAAFADEAPRAGDRLTFARIQIHGEGLAPGSYRITHPYGSKDFNVANDSGGQFDFINDIDTTNRENFTDALRGPIDPFLVWDAAVPPSPPNGYIGDPNFPHKVVGSPKNTNFLRIERNPGGGFRQVGFTDLFSVAGKIARFIDPRGAPTVSAPSFVLREGAFINESEEVPVHLRWKGNPGVKPISSFQLETNYNGAGFWRVEMRNPAEPAATLTIAPGSWQFRSRAIDIEGRAGPFSTSSYRLSLLSELSPSLNFDGRTWSSVSFADALGGKVSTTSQPGASATLNFSGTSIAWIATQSNRNGVAEILLDGVSQGTVDLYSPIRRTRQLIFAKNGLREGPHTLTIRATGRKNTSSTQANVDIDAFAVIAPMH